MKGLDRAKTAALSLTGVVVATAIGVAVTAAARSPEPVNAAGERTIALVSPRATSAPADDATPSPAASVGGEENNRGPDGNSARVGSSGPGSGSGAGSSGPGRARAAVGVSGGTRGDGTPEDAPGSPPGDTRGDGTPEDGDNDNDSDDDQDSDDDDRSGHRGGDDGAKDNSGPGNYENPGRSNSGGDDDD